MKDNANRGAGGAAARGRRAARAATVWGFTLIELLVVIAIIAVLAALLLAALTRARAAADTSACRSNLHQWGLAMHLYLNDYRAYPPCASDAPGNTQWYDRMARYTGPNWPEWNGTNFAPSPRQGVGVCPCYARYPGANNDIYGSYGYNISGGDLADPDGPGYGLVNSGGLPVVREVPGVAVAEGDVLAPGQMVAIGDAQLLAVLPGTTLLPGVPAFGPGNQGETVGGYLDLAGGVYEFTVQSGIPWNSSAPYASAAVMEQFDQRRHGGRYNVVFCDGHVETLRPAALFDLRQDTVLRRWNRDNVAHRSAGGIK